MKQIFTSILVTLAVAASAEAAQTADTTVAIKANCTINSSQSSRSGDKNHKANSETQIAVECVTNIPAAMKSASQSAAESFLPKTSPQGKSSRINTSHPIEYTIVSVTEPAAIILNDLANSCMGAGGVATQEALGSPEFECSTVIANKKVSATFSTSTLHGEGVRFVVNAVVSSGASPLEVVLEMEKHCVYGGGMPVRNSPYDFACRFGAEIGSYGAFATQLDDGKVKVALVGVVPALAFSSMADDFGGAAAK